MPEIRKIKRKDLDLEKYSKAINEALNYRIYAEYWYLDILTNEKWECWVYGNYEVIMPVPLQYKFGFKFVLQPIYCQQLGVFYKEEISDELFTQFEKELHKYRVRAYHFNEENTERYKPEGERRVNYILDLNRPYEDIFKSYRKDRKRNIIKAGKSNYVLTEPNNLEQFLELSRNYYQSMYLKFVKNNTNIFEGLLKRKKLLQYLVTVNNEPNNHRIFIISQNRVYIIASSRNKNNKIDFSSFLINSVIQKFSNKELVLDFEGSMIKGIANFNESFGSIKRYYASYSNFRF